jgi:hypothetical protein
MAFPLYDGYHQFLEHFADRCGIHPNTMFLKGSTKIGFTIKPKPDRVWMKYGDASDLDLTIVDSRLFETIESEVGIWERDDSNRRNMFKNPRLRNDQRNRANNKGWFRCFRFFDLPPLSCMHKLDEAMKSAPVKACCQIDRPRKAFVFRDWWGVYERYEYDLHQLTKGIQSGSLMHAPAEPRQYQEEL